MKRGFLSRPLKTSVEKGKTVEDQTDVKTSQRDQESNAGPSASTTASTPSQRPVTVGVGPDASPSSAFTPPSSTAPLNLQPLRPEKTRKAIPTSSQIPFQFQYSPSPSGIDSNLLILLHGLGDTLKPFSSLAKTLQKTLPQCATLTLQGTHPLPILEEGSSFSWWKSLTPLGEVLGPAEIDPRTFIERDWSKVMTVLTSEEKDGGLGWPEEGIHVLGFGQGATAVMEAVIAWTRKTRRDGDREVKLGSVVSICGDLLSLPIFKPPIATSLLYFHRQATLPSSRSSSLRKAFQHITFSSHPISGRTADSSPVEKMPVAEEWDEIMAFWSRTMRNRGAWERNEGNQDGGQGEVFRIG